MKRLNKPRRVCGDCIHYNACSMWNVGSLLNTNAENCVNYERPVSNWGGTPEAQGIPDSMIEAARNGEVYL